MKKNLLICAVLLTMSLTALAQTNLTIKKKSSMKIPGMPEMLKMPAGMPNPMDSMQNRKSTVYVKGSRMRTDMPFNQYDGKTPMTQTTIFQCDKQRMITFSNKKKKYYVDSTVAPTSATTKNSQKGGYVTVTGSVTDTGERAKLFGYDTRHLKETITFTPSKNACMKDKMQIEIESWYADVPEFFCPIKRNMSEFRMDKNCFDDVDFQMKGSITGLALKEIKKITAQGQTIIMDEEAVEILKTPLADSLFEPPTDYKPANTLKEIEDDSSDDSSNTNVTTPKSKENSNNSSSTFALPSAAIEKTVSTAKKTNMIRIGIAKPKVITPDSKKDPNAGSEIASAVTNSLLELLKAENVEAIQLETDLPENEAKENGCDYIFYANVTQKRGGGMFGKMIAMGSMTAASVFVPGDGGMIAGTAESVAMSQTMGKNAKAKDEFLFDYKVTDLNYVVLLRAISKDKTKNDGEDVLTPQINKSSTAVLSEIAKKK